jgi:hypothetical protein
VSQCWLLCVALLLAIPTHGQQGTTTPGAPAQPTTQLAERASDPASPATEIQVECLPASRASELIDKRGCIVGKVFRVRSQKNGNTRIALCNECDFHALIQARDRDTVGDLSYLHGRFVAILGEVTNYRGEPQIVVTNRQQIRVAAGDPPPEFDAAKGGLSGRSTSGRTRGRAW